MIAIASPPPLDRRRIKRMSGAPILTAEQMRNAEQHLFASGVPEYDVMERAGAAAANIIWRVGASRDALILCGPGNNGGDGFVIARLLRDWGVAVRVAVAGESRTASAQKARAAWDGAVEDIATAMPATQLVDALFGTGLVRPLDEKLSARLAYLTAAAKHSYAIDLPSGMDSDRGACLSPVPDFDICIALGSYKPSHFLQPAASRFAQLVCADIGIDPSASALHLLRSEEHTSELQSLMRISYTVFCLKKKKKTTTLLK